MGPLLHQGHEQDPTSKDIMSEDLKIRTPHGNNFPCKWIIIHPLQLT